MGFVGIFWKNNVQEAVMPKMSISGQIVSELLAQLCPDKPIHTNRSMFLGRPQKHLERFVWTSSRMSWIFLPTRFSKIQV